MQYRKEQLQLHQEAKQQAKELALEQENEKQRRLDKLREQVWQCCSCVKNSQQSFLFAAHPMLSLQTDVFPELCCLETSNSMKYVCIHRLPYAQ